MKQESVTILKLNYNNSYLRLFYGEVNLIAYKARIISGDMKLIVHNDAKWVSFDELKDFDFTPADIELIKQSKCPKEGVSNEHKRSDFTEKIRSNI